MDVTSELYIDVQPKKIAIALTEDKRLAEYQEEEQSVSFAVGNVYLAKVRKLMPGLNACFVSVGYEHDAFLHYLDLGLQFSSYAKYLKQVQSDRKNLYSFEKASVLPELPKDGSVQTYLQQGQEVLVQIIKEPISTKGPRLSCDLSFPGRFLVFTPFGDKVSVSTKIKSSAERARLKQIIYINNADVFKEVHDYVSLIAPERLGVVKLYKGSLPIFDNFDVTRQIKSSFGRIVSYKHGAYLIIEHTEALHVVDVNSGNRTRNAENQEANALEVNLGAAEELARQLRLRDMGGIIVVDFIDMKRAEARQQLYEHMCELMKRDRARHNILPLSKFCLMQITRQRVRPVMDVAVEEACPTCQGTGQIKSSFLFHKVLEGKIKFLYYRLGMKRFTLHVHPYVAAYLNEGLFSLRRKWQLRYGLGVKVIPSQKLAFLQYEFYDKDGQEIDVKEEIEIR